MQRLPATWRDDRPQPVVAVAVVFIGSHLQSGHAVWRPVPCIAASLSDQQRSPAELPSLGDPGSTYRHPRGARGTGAHDPDPRSVLPDRVVQRECARPDPQDDRKNTDSGGRRSPSAGPLTQHERLASAPCRHRDDLPARRHEGRRVTGRHEAFRAGVEPAERHALNILSAAGQSAPQQPASVIPPAPRRIRGAGNHHATGGRPGVWRWSSAFRDRARRVRRRHTSPAALADGPPGHPGRYLGARCEVQLGENVGHVARHCRPAQVEAACDGGVGQALRNQLRHLELPG